MITTRAKTTTPEATKAATTDIVQGRVSTRARPIELGTWATWSVEITWLVLLVVVPAAFDPAGTLAFEPLKTSLVRVGAVLAALAWLRRRISTNAEVADVGAHPVVRAALLFIALGALSTALSPKPALSLFGSFDRGMGWLSLAVGGAVVLCAADVFADGVRRERLISALVLGAIVPCAYLFLQRIGRDPIAWTTLGTPGSTLASPTFLGGYLVMVAPFAVYRVVRAGRSASFDYAGWLALLLVVCTATLLTTIRGPILGLCVGIGTFGLIAAIGRRIGRLYLAAGAGVLCVVVLGLAVAAGGSGGTTGLQRFLAIARVGDSSVERLTVWRDATPLPLVDAGRALFGFGPESQAAVLERAEATVRLTQAQQWDRAHDLLLDTWLTQGALGVTALLAVIGLAVSSAWRSRRDHPLLAAALLGALAGHLVEVSFAFESVTSSLLFWLIIGLTASLTPRGARPRLSVSRWPVRIGVVCGLALVPLLAAPAVADLLYGQARHSRYADSARLEETAAAMVPWVEELPRVAALDWQHVSGARLRVERDLLAAASRAPADPFPALRLTRWYLLAGDISQASAWCDRAMAVGPYRDAVWKACADVSLAEGNADEAASRRARGQELGFPL